MDKIINYNGAPLFYRMSGSGPGVILIHGFAEDNAVWEHLYQHLRQHYQVIVPDLPGSGKSAPAEDMSMEGLANSIYQVIHHEKIARCTVIGHSMGGYVTLAVAEKYPQVLNGFGLFHSSAFEDSEEKKTTRKKGIEFIVKNSAADFLKTTTPNLFSTATKQTQPSLIEEHLSHISYFTREPLNGYYKSMMQRSNRVHVLKNSAVPVLFIIGEQDTAVPLQDSLQQCHLPSVSFVHLLSASAHMGMYEQKEQSSQAIDQFLSMLS